MKKIAVSAEEQRTLDLLSTEQLRHLATLKDSGHAMNALSTIVNATIDIEKNYIFGLNEVGLSSYDLAIKHAFSRGQAAFGVRIVRLINASSSELAKREETKKRQREETKSE